MSYPTERTLFIGDQVQFRASLTLSDGSTQTAEDVTWTSDAIAVATVSASGLVAAVAAGEATISAEVPGSGGGSVRIRVFPEFQGHWAGDSLSDRPVSIVLAVRQIEVHGQPVRDVGGDLLHDVETEVAAVGEDRGEPRALDGQQLSVEGRLGHPASVPSGRTKPSGHNQL